MPCSFSCSSCFSAEGTTLLQDGSTKKIADLDVGDMVQAADASGRLFFDKARSSSPGTNDGAG